MDYAPTSFNPHKPHILVEGGMQYKLGELINGNLINYDFQKIINYLNIKGKLLFGKKFRLYEEDKNLLLKLAAYFVNDKQYCAKLGIDTNKGLLLSGPVGCGKTTLMKLFPYLVPHKRNLGYSMIPSRNVVFSFNNLGFKIIEDYSDAKNYCFDDLGIEPTGRHYGKDCNVMGEIILSRYELFLNKTSGRHPGLSHRACQSVDPGSYLNDKQNAQYLPLKSNRSSTHITTNLNAQELEERYGNRVRSRMREMFNLIAFDKESKDKRI